MKIGSQAAFMSKTETVLFSVVLNALLLQGRNAGAGYCQGSTETSCWQLLVQTVLDLRSDIARLNHGKCEKRDLAGGSGSAVRKDIDLRRKVVCKLAKPSCISRLPEHKQSAPNGV